MSVTEQGGLNLSWPQIRVTRFLTGRGPDNGIIFVYYRTLFMRAVKTLVGLRRRIHSPVPTPFYIRGNPKRVLWQTVKTQMKCCISLHFIRVYTVSSASSPASSSSSSSSSLYLTGVFLDHTYTDPK